VRLALILTLVGAAAILQQPPAAQTRRTDRPMLEVKLITLDPAHFHAALVQKRMYPGVSNLVDIYALLGFDL
jgi:hypothetical protein